MNVNHDEFHCADHNGNPMSAQSAFVVVFDPEERARRHLKAVAQTLSERFVS